MDCLLKKIELLGDSVGFSLKVLGQYLHRQNGTCLSVQGLTISAL